MTTSPDLPQMYVLVPVRGATPNEITANLTALWSHVAPAATTDRIDRTDDDDGVATEAAAVSGTVRVVEAQPGTTGWTVAEVELVLGQLGRSGAWLLEKALRSALKGSGLISRAAILELSEDPNRTTLKGFTRPMSRVIRELTDRHQLVPAVRPELFSPVYEAGTAIAYQVPGDLLAVWQSAGPAAA